MSKTLCVLLRQPPYGSLDAAECVRHLSGALSNGLRPVGLLMDDGVYLAKARQQVVGDWTSLGGALEDLLAQTAAGATGEIRHAVVYVHAPSLSARGLGEHDLVPGCRVVDDAEAAAILGRADATLVY